MSLPTPLSPVISTLASPSAARSASRNTSDIWELPNTTRVCTAATPLEPTIECILKRSRGSKSYTLRDVARVWIRLPPSTRSKLLRPQFLRGVPPPRPATSAHSDENESSNLSRLFVPDFIFLGEKSTCSRPFGDVGDPSTLSPGNLAVTG